MAKLSYALIHSFFWVLTRLPLGVLYLISDFLFIIIYYIIGYRKKLCLYNLASAFPDKDQKEIQGIARNFFRHLTDYFIESIYLLGLSKEEARSRYKYKNPEILKDLYAKGKSVVLVLPHYGNWEWLAALPLSSSHKILGIYKPLANRAFDKLFITLRERFGVEAVPMKQTLRRILELKSQEIPTLSLFLYDQRPLWNELHYWLPFLNQDIPVLLGAEKVARKSDQAVVFLKTKKTRRGHYENEFILLYEEGRSIPNFKMTNQFWSLLENLIREEPAYWLWSHDRWKFHKQETAQA